MSGARTWNEGELLRSCVADAFKNKRYPLSAGFDHTVHNLQAALSMDYSHQKQVVRRVLRPRNDAARGGGAFDNICKRLTFHTRINSRLYTVVRSNRDYLFKLYNWSFTNRRKMCKRTGRNVGAHK